MEKTLLRAWWVQIFFCERGSYRTRSTKTLLFCAKSFYIPKSRGVQFLWNRIWGLGWYGANWAIWAVLKISAILLKYFNFEGIFFYIFKSKNVSVYYSVCTRKLSNIRNKKPWFFPLKCTFLGQNSYRLKSHIKLIGIAQHATFIKKTLVLCKAVDFFCLH